MTRRNLIVAASLVAVLVGVAVADELEAYVASLRVLHGKVHAAINGAPEHDGLVNVCQTLQHHIDDAHGTLSQIEAEAGKTINGSTYPELTPMQQADIQTLRDMLDAAEVLLAPTTTWNNSANSKLEDADDHLDDADLDLVAGDDQGAAASAALANIALTGQGGAVEIGQDVAGRCEDCESALIQVIFNPLLSINRLLVEQGYTFGFDWDGGVSPSQQMQPAKQLLSQ